MDSRYKINEFLIYPDFESNPEIDSNPDMDLYTNLQSNLQYLETDYELNTQTGIGDQAVL